MRQHLIIHYQPGCYATKRNGIFGLILPSSPQNILDLPLYDEREINNQNSRAEHTERTMQGHYHVQPVIQL